MSTRWDADHLLQPVTAEQPCGESLEDTPLLASFDEFRVFGQSIALDPAPDWGDGEAEGRGGARRRARTCACWRTSEARCSGRMTCGRSPRPWWWRRGGSKPTGTGPIRWSHEDIIFRRNALNCFADPVAMVDAFRRVPLVDDPPARQLQPARHGNRGAASSQPREGEARRREAQLERRLRRHGDRRARRAAPGRRRCGAAALKDIDARMREAAGADGDARLRRPVDEPGEDGALSRRAARVARGRRGSRRRRTSTPAARPPRRRSGAVKSREDAIRALDAVADFFRRTSRRARCRCSSSARSGWWRRTSSRCWPTSRLRPSPRRGRQAD